MESIKLQKYFSDCGIMSRRAAEEEIAAGHVKVNGKVASLGDRVVPGADRIVWNGRGITQRKASRITVALNKPRGYVCTMHDEKDRKNVSELVADVGSRLYPIGRLDMASDGLLLMTDDGELANLLTHPAHHVPKVYRVSVKGKIDEATLSKLGSALVIDGRPIVPVEVTVVDRKPDGARLEMTLYEGRNRQIRKMCEACGLEVSRLKRIRIGDISVNGIAPGTYRVLGDAEVAALRRAAKKGPKEENGDA